jgi:hypothetical protein
MTSIFERATTEPIPPINQVFADAKLDSRSAEIAGRSAVFTNASDELKTPELESDEVPTRTLPSKITERSETVPKMPAEPWIRAVDVILS